MNPLFLVFCINLCVLCIFAGAQEVGVNYGLLGDNLPPPERVVDLLKYNNIEMVRIFDPNPDVLRALQNSGIEVVVGVRNQDLEQLAANPSFATQWIYANILPYIRATKFRYISVGNEVIPGPLAQFVLVAMQNLDVTLKAARIPIPVTAAVHSQIIGPSFPPSNGAFSEESASIMSPIVAFLVSNQYPILVNLYPYFAYASDPVNIGLDYALGNSNASGIAVLDGVLKYDNMLDAMVDTVYSALEKAGGASVRIVVSETGWPSAGNEDKATIANAYAYVNNVIRHVKSSDGTPKRPGIPTETYIFAIFNEDLKPAGTEQNFGLYYPDMTQVYPINFSA